MRLNRRVPVGTHGGVRGRLSYLFRGVSYSITLLRILKGGGRLDCHGLTTFSQADCTRSLSILLPQMRRK